ncbi:hypothetical protein [Pseudoduganella violaceinigra]|uniref:hypothetical protein n=1 Tax=Pseudoduganella violaceinigra TaxID=246602 RepID=UPI000486E8A5|nr:hypothetical protein [Pseudoduganella violaceinigra]
MQKIATRHDGIDWPQQCAVCNGKANRRLAVDMSAVSGIAVGAPHAKIQSTVTRIWHPICQRHYWRTWIASGLSQRSLVTLGLGIIAVCALLSAAGQVADLPFDAGLVAALENLGWGTALCMGYGVLFWLGLFWAKRNTPVKIIGASLEGVLFLFSNNEYAQRFSELNRRQIGASLAWLKDEKNRVAEQGDLACQSGLPKSVNPYRAPNTAQPHFELAAYWDRGFAVAEQRLKTAGKS